MSMILTERQLLALYLQGKLGPNHEYGTIFIDECSHFSEEDWKKLSDRFKESTGVAPKEGK